MPNPTGINQYAGSSGGSKDAAHPAAGTEHAAHYDPEKAAQDFAARRKAEASAAQRARTNQLRQPSGQYGHGLNAMCACGRTKGEHLAARPFPHEDGTCTGFKKAKR